MEGEKEGNDLSVPASVCNPFLHRPLAGTIPLPESPPIPYTWGMSMGRVLVIGFWVVVIPLALYTFISERIAAGHRKEDARPQYREAPRQIRQMSEEIETASGAKVEITGYEVTRVDDQNIFLIDVQVRNAGQRPISGTLTIYPYRHGNSMLRGNETNITESSPFWSASQSMSILRLPPGKTSTYTFTFKGAELVYPAGSFHDVTAKLDVEER